MPVLSPLVRTWDGTRFSLLLQVRYSTFRAPYTVTQTFYTLPIKKLTICLIFALISR